MNVSLTGIRISSIATAIPGAAFNLSSLGELFGDLEVQRIMKNTGINKVRLAPEGVMASDLCEIAARRLLSKVNDTNLITGLVFVSQTPDYILPPTSILLQDRLHLPKKLVAFDINSGCAGYIYGLYQGALLVSSGSCAAVLVCVGDAISRFVNPRDKANRMLFGDAGSATLIERGSQELAFSFMSDGSGAHHLIIPAGGCRHPRNDQSKQSSTKEHGNIRSDEDLYMDGMQIMNFMVREVPKIVDSVLALKAWQKDEVGFFGFHQANKFMLEYLRKKMKLTEESVPIVMSETGNTGPTSIPLLLSQEYKELAQEKRLNKALLCGFGVGLSCGAVALDLSATEIYDPIEM